MQKDSGNNRVLSSHVYCPDEVNCTCRRLSGRRSQQQRQQRSQHAQRLLRRSRQRPLRRSQPRRCAMFLALRIHMRVYEGMSGNNRSSSTICVCLRSSYSAPHAQTKSKKPASWLKARPTGCPKCRNIPGCAPSCWRDRPGGTPKPK